MDILDLYYQAYRSMADTLHKAKSYRGTFFSAREPDRGTDVQTGSLYRVVVDLDWVEAIEECLPCIDAAIREKRRFIEQTEEIVPIARSRKITSESTKHLARHTNLIASVENGKVTPEKILNIHREESFAIYENRFLYTLLQRVYLFIDTRYKAIKGKPEHAVNQLEFSREFTSGQDRSQISISYSAKSRDTEKFHLDDNTDILTDLQRVERVRSIILDFLSTPLMKELRTAEPVRPPIMRTNLMVKNPNFRQALELWTFIETYTKDGYSYVAKEFDGHMEPEVKKGLYEMATMLDFVVQIKSNPALDARMEQRYDREQKKQEELREEARHRVERQQKARLTAALDQERALWRQKEGQLTREYENRLQEQVQGEKLRVDALIERYGAEIDRVKADCRLEIASVEAKSAAARRQEKLDREKERAELAQAAQTRLETAQREGERRLAEARAEGKAALQAAQERAEQEKAGQAEQNRQALAALQQAHAEELAACKQREAAAAQKAAEESVALREKLEKQRQRYEKELAQLRAAAREERATLTAQRTAAEKALQQTRSENEKRIKDLQREHKKALRRAGKQTTPWSRWFR